MVERVWRVMAVEVWYRACVENHGSGDEVR